MGDGKSGIYRHSAVAFAVTLLLLVGLAAPLASLAQQPQDHLDQQRDRYHRATRALARGDRATFATLKNQLSQYPLHPYLDYADLATRLGHGSDDEIVAFLAGNPGTPYGARLRQRWLQHLAQRHNWEDFVRHYDSQVATTEMQCQYALALYRQGDKERGIAEGRQLWQVGKSQPNACDPLFAELADSGHIDDTLAWQRFASALFNHDYRLARYVTRFFTRETTRARADLYLRTDQNPRLIAEYARFAERTPEESRLIRHGLIHLAPGEPLVALNLWNRYHQSHSFSTDDEGAIIAALIKGLYQAGQRQTADDYLLRVQNLVGVELFEWRLRELVKEQDWRQLLVISAALNPTHRAESRWRYWRARALELGGAGDDSEIRQLYQDLAGERSYYGFLASEYLGTPYQMQHQPVAVTAAELAELAASPAFLRIRELHHHGDLDWARREWNQALADAPQQRWLTAAKLAQQWQWHHQAINSMIQVSYWNDIEVRFPVPHREDFLTQARAKAIPVNLVLALSRQESAFNPTAVSPAGARGLMQLMPATARETARRHGIPYTGSGDLQRPATNITLGTAYYREMLDRFDNNRILATAAYNAGPGRVATWRRQTGGQLPFDIWIESIPFRETRNYVQNVLAFSIIYAHHLGLDTALLSERERAQRL